MGTDADAILQQKKIRNQDMFPGGVSMGKNLCLLSSILYKQQPVVLDSKNFSLKKDNWKKSEEIERHWKKQEKVEKI